MSASAIVVVVGLMLVGATFITLTLRRRHPDRAPLVPPQRFLAWWLIVGGLVATYLVGTQPEIGRVARIVTFTILSMLALRQFFSHLNTPLSRHTKLVCYLAAVLQYYWIYIEWYGFFLVFVPVFLFLYLPASGSVDAGRSTLLHIGSVHWVMMTAIFCLSHAAYLVVLPSGLGLLFFVLLITEFSDAARMLLHNSGAWPPSAPVLSVLVAIATAWIVAPAFTPLTPGHTLLAGLVLGIGGSIGFQNIASLREEIGIQKGGPLERVESLAYTAPIFLHGYRYFDYPI